MIQPGEKKEEKKRNSECACMRKMELRTRGEHLKDSFNRAKSKYPYQVQFFFTVKRKSDQKPSPKNLSQEFLPRVTLKRYDTKMV
ncbi:hypothetical protein V1478_000349 [Vespula squamosa]|uniref:Uncharacterized protein n=1 Tax=Vespula squamosa TaxID=30214 RepID=A0ABD2C7A5_VESSQ